MAHLITEFFDFIGRLVQIHTLVDYYNYVKAVEYLICLGFFVVFPIFYRDVIKYRGDVGKHERHDK